MSSNPSFLATGKSLGFDYRMEQGDIEWTRVRKELARISFDGWTTAEVRRGDRRRLAEVSAEMNTILSL